MVYRAQEYPPLETEGAVALCLFGVGVSSFAGCGVETVTGGRYPYLVHSGHLSSVGQASGCCRIREAVSCLCSYSTISSPFCNLVGAFLVQYEVVVKCEGEAVA
jgi:hypothetical protein